MYYASLSMSGFVAAFFLVCRLFGQSTVCVFVHISKNEPTNYANQKLTIEQNKKKIQKQIRERERERKQKKINIARNGKELLI